MFNKKKPERKKTPTLMELMLFVWAESRKVGVGRGCFFQNEPILKPVVPRILVAAAFSLCPGGKCHPHFLHSPQRATNTSWCVIGFYRWRVAEEHIISSWNTSNNLKCNIKYCWSKKLPPILPGGLFLAGHILPQALACCHLLPSLSPDLFASPWFS